MAVVVDDMLRTDEGGGYSVVLEEAVVDGEEVKPYAAVARVVKPTRDSLMTGT